MVDYTEKEKDWENYNQHTVNVDIADTLVRINDILQTHQKMIELLAKYVGMPIEVTEDENIVTRKQVSIVDGELEILEEE